MRSVTQALALAGLFMAVGTAGCFGPGQDPVDFETVEKGFFTGYDSDGFQGLIIDNRTQWAVFWEEHEKNRHPKHDAPFIDFNARFVVALLMGDRPTGGYEVNVTQVEGDADEYTVTYYETEPCEGCSVTMAQTSPYHIISVERLADGTPRADWQRVAAPS